MNKYNIGDTVYYANEEGVQKGEIRQMWQNSNNKMMYRMKSNYIIDYPENCIHPTVDELIEWLKTTVK